METKINIRTMESTPFSEILRRFLSKNKREADFKAHSVVHVFQQVLPPQYRPYVKKVTCVNGVLFVQVDSAALKFELMTQRSVIKDQINKQIGVEVVKDVLLK